MLTLSTLAGLATGLGGLIVVIKRPGEKLMGLLMGLAAGIMVAIAFLELVSQALKSGEMNEVHVLLSDGGQLLHLGVNNEWPVSEAGILISDNELGLTNAVNAERRQLCILHALKYLLFTLWGEGISRDDRIKVENAAKHALFMLVNSTKRHLRGKDGDRALLKAGIERTLGELYEVADGLRERGYTRTSAFIMRNARFMVTFAELALEGVEKDTLHHKQDRTLDGGGIQTVQEQVDALVGEGLEEHADAGPGEVRRAGDIRAPPRERDRRRDKAPQEQHTEHSVEGEAVRGRPLQEPGA